MRLRKKPWIKDEIITYEQWVPSQPEDYRGRWNQWFNNDLPIYVELGTGKGNFITSLAEIYPSLNFIGVEVREEVLISAVRKAAKKNLKNVAFLWIDINKIEEIFAQGEVSRLFLNFSDPWPKTRHAKRRLTHRDFLTKYKYLLSLGQEIHLKTDNEKLFEFSLNEFSDTGFRLKSITFDLHQSQFEEAKEIMTEYEEKFVNQGMKIYRVEAIYQQV